MFTCRCGNIAVIAIGPNDKKAKFGLDGEGYEHMCRKCYELYKDEQYHYKRHIEKAYGSYEA